MLETLFRHSLAVQSPASLTSLLGLVPARKERGLPTMTVVAIATALGALRQFTAAANSAQGRL